MDNPLTSRCTASSSLERVNYFPRMIVTAKDMLDEDKYFREKLRRHNRMLHGWGVVCGCEVRQKRGESGQLVPWTVEVSPGCVLDPPGNEIEIPRPVTYNLRGLPSGDTDPCGRIAICGQPEPGKPIYLAVCYDECETRPVRVASAGCGCDASECEYSRIRESFCLTVLSELPDYYKQMGVPRSWEQFNPCDYIHTCPPHPDETCVILADITVEDTGNLAIDSFSHRRYVISFADFYVTCGSSGIGMTPVMVAAQDLDQHLDRQGMERLQDEHGGALGAAVMLPVTALRGLGASSEVGKALEAVTIGQAAAMTLEEFKQEAEARLAGIDPGKRRYFERQTESIWTAAREVERLTGDYRATGVAKR